MKVVFVYLLIAFALGQLAALALGALFIGAQLSVVENPEDPSNALTLLGYVLVSAAALLLLLKFYSGGLFFKAIEFVLVFFSVNVVASFFVDPMIAIVLGLVAASARFFIPQARMVLLVYSAAVAGALLGASLGILPSLGFAVLLAVYDYIAVFHTKHMVTLAKGLTERDAAFSVKISIGQPPAKTALSSKSASTKRAAGQKTVLRRVGESIELGTGDFVIPAMVTVSALKLSQGYALGALAGSLAGTLLLLWLLEKRKGYFPALPPIVGGSLVGLAIAAACVAAFGL